GKLTLTYYWAPELVRLCAGFPFPVEPCSARGGPDDQARRPPNRQTASGRPFPDHPGPPSFERNHVGALRRADHTPTHPTVVRAYAFPVSPPRPSPGHRRRSTSRNPSRSRSGPRWPVPPTP